MKNKHFLIGWLFLFSATLASCGSKTPQKTDYQSTLLWKENFAILQLTDIHWSFDTDRVKQKAYLNAVFSAAEKASVNQRIDLVMVTGDSGLMADTAILEDLFETIRSWNTPYGVTWGNHDRQGYYSVDFLDHLAKEENFPGQSVYKDVDDDVYGRSNYVVNLKEGDETKWQVFSFDSNSYQQSGNGVSYDYDYIHDDQVTWFEGLSEAKPSLCYFHIPLREWKYAFENVSGKTSKSKWEINESICCSSSDSRLFSSAKSHDVKAMFCGHDHSNDYTATYDGIVLGYGVKSGGELYFSHSDSRQIDILGGSLVELHSDESFALRHVYVQDDSLSGYPVTSEEY